MFVWPVIPRAQQKYYVTWDCLWYQRDTTKILRWHGSDYDNEVGKVSNSVHQEREFQKQNGPLYDLAAAWLIGYVEVIFLI